MTRYKPDRSSPIAVETRKNMAVLYRKIRKDNPAMARLLMIKMRQAEAAVSAAVLNEHWNKDLC